MRPFGCKLVPINVAKPVTADVLKPHVTNPRQAKPIITKPHSPPRRHINHSPSLKASNFPLKVTTVKVPQVNAAKGVQGKLDFDDVYFVKELKKVDEGFLVRYSVSSKALRVFNSRTRIVQETLHINFLENKPNVAGEERVQQYVLFPVWSSGSTNPQNTDVDTAFEVKKPEFKGSKPQSEVYVSLSSSAYSCCWAISTNITNNFSAAGPSNAAVSLTHGKSSYVDSSQLHDDPNMLELEDITYSDDEYDVGAEADFNNLEISIIVSPILTSRVHKDHHGIDYEEVFALIARIEAIRLFLAYASFMGFMVYQMDVKSAFLYGTIEEEVYVCQPPGFEDPDYPDKIYVDDIIFGSTNKDLCKAFVKLMKDKFQMSSMGELKFFLGLQVKQKKDGIFISQDKYVAKTLRKFGLTDGKSTSTPIDTEKPLIKDPNGEDVDVHTYRSMIGSLMYLTSSRPDIMFVVCACARFQVTPKASHLHAVKRIFRYLKGKPYLGLWYPKDSPFNFVAYSDSDYAGVSLDRKSTTGGCQFLRCRLISW
uniref:Uncharacterized mitochondrial protein AtMg00810-like n=1 Tax=Tanacetum cinerariifolium TaxID=118510 RepID=A0A6L2LMI9_TANCI|nr:uncharacterized mitochondrial protein AtMg00810-like [Tanacetum cinerariifolium]